MPKNIKLLCINYPGIEDHRDVYVSCEPVRAQWYTLAIYLYVDKGTISTIKKDCDSCDEWLSEMLDAWLKRRSPGQPKPSWRLLCEALSRLDAALSERVSQQHPCQCLLCTAATGIIV